MRRCLMLRQGASPLKPRPPFPLNPCSRTEGIRQGFASRAKIRRALDRFPPFRTLAGDEGKGAQRQDGLVSGAKPSAFRDRLYHTKCHPCPWIELLPICQGLQRDYGKSVSLTRNFRVSGLPGSRTWRSTLSVRPG